MLSLQRTYTKNTLSVSTLNREPWRLRRHALAGLSHAPCDSGLCGLRSSMSRVPPLVGSVIRTLNLASLPKSNQVRTELHLNAPVGKSPFQMPLHIKKSHANNQGFSTNETIAFQGSLQSIVRQNRTRFRPPSETNVCACPVETTSVGAWRTGANSA